MKKCGARMTILSAIATLYFILYYIVTMPEVPDQILKYQDVVMVNNEVSKEFLSYKSRRSINMKIRRENIRQKIWNEGVFGPIRDDTVIILIQVHKRIQYLKHLIDSLSYVYGISKSLLIFSHDYYDEPMNYLVRNISFCRTMQIFYPYSTQINPDQFPGDDTKHCPKRRPLRQIEGCQGSYDSYYNLRKAEYCQMKHHWFWNMNIVFDRLYHTKNHTGIVIYAEEDYYVMSDLLHVLNLMVELSTDGAIDVFSLISSKRLLRYPEDYSDQYYVGSWNMDGIAMNRLTWNKIKKCSFAFCAYDDYNWDWSLLYLTRRCVNLTSMVLRLPRMFHIGKCGMHGKYKRCQSWKAVRGIRKVFAKIQRSMFPENLAFSTYTPVEETALPFGGWGDKRDRELCLNMTKI